MAEARAFLNYVADNLPDLRRSSQPLWHPLGFVSCVIPDGRSEHTIRIHLWPKGERRVKRPHWPIHTHAYRLSSYVLAGCVHDLQYHALPSGSHTVYSVDYYDGGSAVVNTGRSIGIEVAIDAQRQAGDQYVVPVGIFHQTEVPLATSALTLVALSDFVKDPPLVLGEALEQRYDYQRMPFDRELFWTTVADSIVQKV